MIVEGGVLPLDRANVDTDQIIPAHFLTGIETTGLGKHLFSGMTGGADLLAAHPGASIVVTRENFGCGSSREHAAWSLVDRGFRAVVAPSFARIFFENAYNNGIAPVIVDDAAIAGLLRATQLRIDLEAQELVVPDGTRLRFELDPLRKQFLFSGGYMAFLASKRDGVRSWLQRRAEASSLQESQIAAPM
jgi:3-isopropylmalate/(R)-2-methylmalate dehydratase small subunit